MSNVKTVSLCVRVNILTWRWTFFSICLILKWLFSSSFTVKNFQFESVFLFAFFFLRFSRLKLSAAGVLLSFPTAPSCQLSRVCVQISTEIWVLAVQHLKYFHRRTSTYCEVSCNQNDAVEFLLFWSLRIRAMIHSLLVWLLDSERSWSSS